MRTRLNRTIIILLITLAFAGPACKSTGETPSAANTQAATASPENLQTRLRKAIANPSAILVVTDTKDIYWAIPASGVKQLNDTNIILNSGVRIAAGSGKGTPTAIAELMVTSRSGQGGYFVSNDGPTSATGQAGETTKPTTLEVKELILVK